MEHRSLEEVSGSDSLLPSDWEEGSRLPGAVGNRLLTEARAEAAAAYPGNLAVITVSGEATPPQCWTHSEIDRLVTRWVARLAKEGIGPGTAVGLCAAGVEVAVGFISILEAGATVVPLDPSLPAARLRAMSDGTGCRMILVSSATASLLGDQSKLNLCEDPGDHPPVKQRLDPEQAAVIYHTSGSTGRPKPVALSHRALSSRILSMIDWFGFGQSEVACAASTLGFDPFLQQLFFPLCTGGTVWFPDRMTLLDPGRFWADAAELGLTHMNCVPAQMEALLHRPPRRPIPTIRRVVLGGERLEPDLAARIADALGPVAIYNMYGPTEATIDATGYRVELPLISKDVPIGKPLPGVRVRILNEQLRRAPAGEAGEICIGGIGLAIGYSGLAEATAEAFITDPYGAPGDRLYRTGDIGRWLADGRISFLGRRDEQLKVRGQRIEPGEIEFTMRQCRGVSAVVVTLWKNAPGGAAVVAHFVGSADPAELRNQLAKSLPAAAVPAYFVRVDALPKLASGKIDRNALPPPVVSRSIAALEQAIAEVWAGILGRHDLDLSANLFEMGVHSLHLPRALIGIEAATGIAVSAVDVFRFPSAAALTRHLAGEREHTPRARRRTPVSGQIAIVGMAFRFPGAADCEAFWADLISGADRVQRRDRAELLAAGAPMNLVDHDEFVPAHAAIDGIDLFDPIPFSYSPGEAAGIDPQQRLLLELGWHALEDASCDPASDGPVGVFAGVGFNAYLVDNLRDDLAYAGSPERFSAVVGADKDFAATRLAYKLGLTGPAMTINSACSTALSVTATAVDSLRAGRCRVALAGAASLGMFSRHGHVWTEGGIASRTGVCRPFDAQADGVVSGAGAAVLALKRLEDAVADGDRVYAVIRGVGMSNDGSRKAAFSAPSVDGQVAAIEAALEDAGVSPSDIGFVEAHGTGTHLGDPVEVAALNAAYRDARRGSILLGSVKGTIGHLDAAAGMAGLIKTVLALRHGVVPPTAHFTTPNPRIPFAEGPFRVSNTSEPWPVSSDLRLAGVSTFGMGGTNVHIVIGAPPDPQPSTIANHPVLVTLSAATAGARDQLAAAVADDLSDPLAESATSLARRRPMRFRRAVVAASAQDAANALRGKALDGEAGRTLPVAFLFPGQGAQQPGMARGICHAFSEARQVIDEAGGILRAEGREDVAALLLAETRHPAAIAALSETQRTQPGLFITEYAIAKTLVGFGVRPAAMIGHSIGEYVAAALAGVMTFEDALRLVIARGRLMASAPHGAMLAASLTESELAPLIVRCGADLAAVNSARQCVASGTEAQIDALAQAVAKAGKQAHRLPVSHAFHSALMETVLDRFGEEAAKVRLLPPSVPIVSNVSGDWLTATEATDPMYWVRHLRGTVRFAAGLQRLIADPAQLLVEAGPGAALTRLSRGAGVPEGRAIATQPPEESDGHTALLRALGRMWIAGAPVDRVLAAGNAARRTSLPGYPFERVRLWIEPGHEAAQPRTPDKVEPSNSEASGVIADVWREVLGVKTISPSDDFLSLGGDSLIAVRIAAKLRGRLGCEVSPGALFNAGTVDGLARQLAPVAITGIREEGWL